MLFAFPYAFLGAAALAALVAVYVFRNRFLQRPVSSLMLWRQVARPRQGGLRRDTLSLPPLFYLELAALAALVVAAAAPLVRRPSLGSLTVVFDASASMSARGADGATAQERAVQALKSLLARNRYARVRLLAAGASGPELVGVSHPAQAAARLGRVTCVAAIDTLERTIARAGEISEAGDEVLVLTDRPPGRAQDDRLSVRWLAVGTPLPNVAITYADRLWREGGTEAVLVEVTGFGAPHARVPVSIRVRGSGPSVPPLAVREVELAEAQPARVVVELPPGTPDVEAVLPDDALALDNRAVLLSEKPRTVQVALKIGEERLRRIVRRTVEATGRARLDAETPQLVFTDNQAGAVGAPYWQVLFCAPAAPRLVRGPYLVDHAQPLLEGLTFDGLVWAVGTNSLAGRGLAFAGAVPLITLEASANQMPVVRLLAASPQATLFQAAAWPVLVWNVLQACEEAQPGPSARNLRVGVQAVFSVAHGEAQAVFETPSGEKTLKARGGRVTWGPEEAGVYRMRLKGGASERFAVNLFAPGEADLRGCARGAWGGGTRPEQLARTHQSYAWLAGLAALVLAACHHALLGRGGRAGGMAA